MPTLSHQHIDDEISRASFDLLLKEPFYAHVLAGMPRVISEDLETIGLKWNGQQVQLTVNPEWFCNKLGATHRKVSLKHEILHLVFRHLFRPADRFAPLYSIAADLVVNQLLHPLKPLVGWPTLEMFPELGLQPDQTVEVYYAALAELFRKMQQKGYRKGHDESSDDLSKAIESSKSAKALAALLRGRGKRGDDAGWYDGRDGIIAAAGRYAVGSLLIRAKERMPPHQWGSLPAALLSELNLILAERQPKLDWKRVVRIFCASSGCTKIRHTIKRLSKRYGTRPGIKVQRLQRLLLAIDTSASIDQEMIQAFFAEVHGAWKAGATVHVVECDAEVQRDYRYNGRLPTFVAGGGGTEFEPVFRWMLDQPKFDGCIYLTDGCGPAPTTRPRCKLLWLITGCVVNELPYGANFNIEINQS